MVGNLDGGFGGWLLHVAPPSNDAAGRLGRCLAEDVVQGSQARDFHSLDELRGFLKGANAPDGVVEAAGELWARYAWWRCQ